jgi:hypothetical protein
MNATLWKRHPLNIYGTALPPNLLLMAKLIVVLLLVKGYFYKIHSPFLPLVPVFEYVPWPYAFRIGLQSVFVVASIALLLNVRVRTAAFLVGLVFLLVPLVTRGSYTNGLFFCASMLMLTAFHHNAMSEWLLKMQIVIMYFGSGLNKLLLEDWRTGQYMDYWLRHVKPSSLYESLAGMMSPMLLAKLLCWGTIGVELFLVGALLYRRSYGIAVALGFLFHVISLAFAGHDFGAFGPAMLAAYLVFFRWPSADEPTPLRYDPRLYFSAALIFGLPDPNWHSFHVMAALSGALIVLVWSWRARGVSGAAA